MKKLNVLYTGSIVVLAITSVVLALLDLCNEHVVAAWWFYPLDTSILIIFAIDYIARFFLAKNKIDFLKNNVFDLIAIIPFNTIFSFFRLFRIFRILRLAKLTKLFRLVGTGMRLRNKAYRFLHTNGLIYIIYLNIGCVLVGAICIFMFEQGVTVDNFGDAVWWSFVTATTVGYGDISPCTVGGRIIAAILMICGIGLISMLTGTVATYFTTKNSQNKKHQQLDALMDVASGLQEKQLLDLIDQAKNYQDR